jgi:hypothetical protein
LSEINVPSAKNSFFSNYKETSKEFENNNKANDMNDNINNSDLCNYRNNTNESLKISLKSENNKINEEKDEPIEYTKSSTYNNHTNQSNNSFINCNNLNDNDNDNLNNNARIQKSRTLQENDAFQRQCFTFHFNNINGNHLETVLETISEVSNSKVDSLEKSNKDEENEDTGKNETKETRKNKDESYIKKY